MSNINAFDPTRGPATTIAPSRTDDPSAAAFSGALDQAEREFQSEDDRRERRDEPGAPLEVLDAQSRLDRSGIQTRRGVPDRTADGPPEEIVITDSPAYRDATSTTRKLETDDGIVRGSTSRNPGAKRWQTARLGTPAGAAIPPPPAPNSVPRRNSTRQTLSYAVRSPASGRMPIPPPPPAGKMPRTGMMTAGIRQSAATHTRATPPPRRTPTGETRVADDSEVTQVWTRAPAKEASSVPSPPPWSRGEEPEPLLVLVRPQAATAATEAADEPVKVTHREDKGAIVSGPLRAYAAAMSAVAPSASALDGGLAGGAEALAPIEATLADTTAAAHRTIGEPISAGLDISPSALQQLSGNAVPPQSEGAASASAHGRLVADQIRDTVAAGNAGSEATAGRLGPQRAEVVLGAGNERVGLAITTAGPHVMVEAQVPNELMADAMRNELDDLKAALERHDLELSDMTFGEATQRDGEQEGGAERAANDDPSRAANDAGDTQDEQAPNGVRIVA